METNAQLNQNDQMPVSKKPRVRKSRSRVAVDLAAAEAKHKAELVMQGREPPPKRNQVFLLDPVALGLVQVGRFWFNTTDPKSFYYMSPEALNVFKQVHKTFDSDAMICEFHRRRSMNDKTEHHSQKAGLRSVESFFVLHCKRNRVVKLTSSGNLVDVKSDYDAMLLRYSRLRFDGFCRGPVTVFDAPESVVKQWQIEQHQATKDTDSGKHGELEERHADLIKESKDEPNQEPNKEPHIVTGVRPIVTGVRPMLCTTAAQLNFFCWMFKHKHFDIIDQTHNDYYKQTAAAKKNHRVIKQAASANSARPGRMSMTQPFCGSFAVVQQHQSNQKSV